VLESGGGLLVDPDDEEAVVEAARQLAESSELRERLGAAARSYAESAFDIEAIGERFARVLASVAGADRLHRELVADPAGDRVRST
jgi:glycosyltransferase involved in cell wall biosynthesis